MDNTDTLHFTCPHCQTPYKVSAKLYGNNVTCKKCRKHFKIQTPEKVPAVPLVGQLALKYRFVTKKQLQPILANINAQKNHSSHTPLANLLVDQGLISNQQRDVLLAAREHMAKRRKDLRFGAIAIQQKRLTQQDLDQALKIQTREFKATGICRGIGDILMDAGKLTAEQCDAVLQLQTQQQPTLPEQNTILVSDSPPAAAKTNLNEYVDIRVSDDRMTASLVVKKDFSNKIDLETIKAIIKAKKIHYGVVADDQIAAYLQSPANHSKPFAIAAGQPPQAGQSARIKFGFNPEYLKMGARTDDGIIEVKNRGDVPHIQAGAVIAEKKPMIAGKPGVDVYGRPIEDTNTQDVVLRCGRGAKLSDDGTQVIAEVEGRPFYSVGGKFFVYPDHHVAGDINLKTGHIDYDGNIRVDGTIQNGFGVKGGNLTAKEILKAEIEVHGDVHVNGGIIGASIRAQGNITARYIKNATISAFGNIVAEKEIVGSHIACSGACHVGKGRIVASTIAAKKGIQSQGIGSKVSNPCELKIGTEDHLETAIADMAAAFKQLKESVQQLKTKANDRRNANNRLHRKITKLAQVQDHAMVQRKKITAAVQTLQKKGDADKLTRARQMLAEIASREKTADKQIKAYFDRQDTGKETLNRLKAKIATAQNRLAELAEERKSISAWAKKEPPVARAEISGTIWPGTVIMGPNSKVVIKNKHQNVRIQEVARQQAHKGLTWAMKVASMP
ncbi:MAG: FapA family protein [Desulfobacterales bacterium]|nr:FapA family protein [Desulfobacterales bacterium]